jgi:hypothetical protein
LERLDFTESELRELAAAAQEQGLAQLAADCERALKGELGLAGCFPLQAAVEAWRRARESGQKEGNSV